MAVATNCLASAIDSAPRFDVSQDALLHMNDVPLPVNAGTPANPLRSLYQTDTIGCRLRMEVAWALRSPAGVAWTQSVVW